MVLRQPPAPAWLACLCACAAVVRGGNPLVPGVGMADPHAHVFPNEPDRVYLFATHDFSPNSTAFRMDDWWLWRSDDLVSWTKLATVAPSAFAWDASPRSCWATDAAFRDGRYFWYVSAGSADVGVLVGDGPAGPWSDPLGAPLLSHEQGAALSPPTTIRDPGTLHDPASGHFYLVFGTFQYYVARLATNMTALAEPPRHLTVRNATSQNGVGVLDDKPYLHAHNGTYYLSYGAFYATSTSPYGPFDYRGTFIDPAAIAPDFLVGNLTSEPWYKREIYKDRHGAFFQRRHQWYFSTNDVSHSKDVHNGNYYRDSVISYVHFCADGTIAPLVINATGVGQYEGRAGAWVEAENYHALNGPLATSRKQELAPGARRFGVAAVGGTTLAFPRVRLRAAAAPAAGGAVLLLRAANGAPGTALVDVRVTASGAPATSPPLAVLRCAVRATGSWAAHATHRCALAAPLPSTVDVHLSFAAGREEAGSGTDGAAAAAVLVLDRFAFELTAGDDDERH